MTADAIGLARVLVYLAVLAASAAAPTLTDQPAADDAEPIFRRALTEPMEPRQRVRDMERIVKEFSDSRWADDALWVLGETARQQGLTGRVLYYWQCLVTRKSPLKLEEFTTTSGVYRTSSLRAVQLLLETEGTAFVPRVEQPAEQGEEADAGGGPEDVSQTGRLWLWCKPFNAAPMVVWAELGDSYERLRKHELALGAYRKALELAPETGRWPVTYRERIRRLEEVVKLRAESGAGAAPQPASAPSEPQQAGGSAPPPAAGIQEARTQQVEPATPSGPKD